VTPKFTFIDLSPDEYAKWKQAAFLFGADWVKEVTPKVITDRQYDDFTKFLKQYEKTDFTGNKARLEQLGVKVPMVGINQ
jgi:hypothetical protein